jgi:N6-adenosine-specific RNA methylase IME4
MRFRIAAQTYGGHAMTARRHAPLLKAHPYASLFPILSASELKELAADIKANGLRYPITLYEGKILDGRNRYAACQRAKVKPKFDPYKGKDPLGYVVSLNIKRRHLSETQRGLVAARVADIPKHIHRDGPMGPSKTVAEAARMMAVGAMTVKRGRAVLASGSAKLIEACDGDKINLRAATKIIKLDKARQDDVVARVTDGERVTEAHRVVKSAEIVKRQLAMPTGKHRIIYADPPLDYGAHEMPGSDAKDHYPVMSLDDICDIPVDQWAEDDAVLFLWVPAPFTLKIAPVISAWGFEFKTEFIWDKIDHNMGHYSSVRHEKLYLCTRGACQPDVRKLFDSVQSIKRTEHSVKPPFFYEIIETLYPIGRRLELFHRGDNKRPGWEYYGLESG